MIRPILKYGDELLHDRARSVEQVTPDIDRIVEDLIDFSRTSRRNGLFARAASPEEVHLVLSATADRDCVDLAIEKFGNVRVDKLIFTKLDETSSYGPILNEAVRTGKPLSFFTNGQRIPEDLETATRNRLAELTLGAASSLAMSAA